MRISLLLLLFIVSGESIYAQQSDFIVLKKRNNRTVKTYFPGAFISASTHNGFQINGIIQSIYHDSVFVTQIEIRQMPTEFGVPKLDTLIYTLGMHYTDISQFFFTTVANTSGTRRKRGFSQVSIPRLMLLGGSAFLALELVNTAYRKEPLHDDSKITTLAIAAAIAGTGLLWQHLKNQETKPGVKFKVVYVK